MEREAKRARSKGDAEYRMLQMLGNARRLGLWWVCDAEDQDLYLWQSYHVVKRGL